MIFFRPGRGLGRFTALFGGMRPAQRSGHPLPQPPTLGRQSLTAELRTRNFHLGEVHKLGGKHRSGEPQGADKPL